MLGRIGSSVVGLMLVMLAGCNDGGPACGDGRCDPGAGESCSTCSVDCGTCAGCGDGVCASSLGESCMSCDADCGGCTGGCGDGVCGASEDCASCPGDCGACTTSCGPTNCAGCCDGDACLGGTSPSGCGVGGNACMACGPSFTCSAGACVVDPASRWNVVLEYLEVETLDANGEAWDAFGGAPDPFVEVRVGSDSATPHVSGAGSDVFEVSFSGGATASNQRADQLQAWLDFQVMDQDTSAHDFVGRCSTTVTEPVFGGGTQTVTCPRDTASGNAGFTLRWHLERY